MASPIEAPRMQPEVSNPSFPVDQVQADLGNLSQDIVRGRYRRNVLKFGGAAGLAASLSLVATGALAQDSENGQDTQINPINPPIEQLFPKSNPLWGIDQLLEVNPIDLSLYQDEINKYRNGEITLDELPIGVARTIEPEKTTEYFMTDPDNQDLDDEATTVGTTPLSAKDTEFSDETTTENDKENTCPIPAQNETNIATTASEVRLSNGDTVLFNTTEDQNPDLIASPIESPIPVDDSAFLSSEDDFSEDTTTENTTKSDYEIVMDLVKSKDLPECDYELVSQEILGYYEENPDVKEDIVALFNKEPDKVLDEGEKELNKKKKNKRDAFVLNNGFAMLIATFALDKEGEFTPDYIEAYLGATSDKLGKDYPRTNLLILESNKDSLIN